MLTKEQLIEILEDYGTDRLADTPWRDEVAGFDHEGYKLRHVERHGGHEGAGEEYWVVFSVENAEGTEKEFWQIPGWYQSHYGSELEVGNLYRVQPVEVKVISWQPLK